MDKSNNITVDGRQINIIYNVNAAEELYKTSHNPNVLVWLAEYVNKDNQNLAELSSRVCKAVEVMANASVRKHNIEVSLGFRDGEKKPFYTEDYFKSVLDIFDAVNLFKDVVETIAKGINFEIPKELKIDDDYLEISASKKN